MRSIDTAEAWKLYNTDYIFPKKFEKNKDSTCPSGIYSFWVNVPAKFEDPFMVVSAEIENYKEYKMTMGITKHNYSVEYHEYVIPEYVIDYSIKPDKIWFNTDFEHMFDVNKPYVYDLMDIIDYEDPEEFHTWCKMQNGIRKLSDIRTYGENYQDIKGKFPCAFRNLKAWLFNEVFRYGNLPDDHILKKDYSGTAI